MFFLLLVVAPTKSLMDENVVTAVLTKRNNCLRSVCITDSKVYRSETGNIMCVG